MIFIIKVCIVIIVWEIIKEPYKKKSSKSFCAFHDCKKMIDSNDLYCKEHKDDNF